MFRSNLRGGRALWRSAAEPPEQGGNVLTGPLKEGGLRPGDPDFRRRLAAVQRRRKLPTRLNQARQALIQRRILSGTLESEEPFAPPTVVRVLLRLLIMRALACPHHRSRTLAHPPEGFSTAVKCGTAYRDRES